LHASKLGTRASPGFRRRESLSLERLGMELDVERHLLVHLALETATVENRAERGGGAADDTHATRRACDGTCIRLTLS
jgi:hypothetical protein